MKLFELSFQYVLYEAQVLWQLSQVFLVGNSFLAGLIGTTLTNGEVDSPWIFSLSILGMVISILWLLAYTRTYNYYKFRIAQATQREPEGWMLFTDDGKYFSKGEPLIVEGTRHSFGIGIFSNQHIVRLLIATFIIFYAIVAVQFITNNVCFCLVENFLQL